MKKKLLLLIIGTFIYCCQYYCIYCLSMLFSLSSSSPSIKTISSVLATDIIFSIPFVTFAAAAVSTNAASGDMLDDVYEGYVEVEIDPDSYYKETDLRGNVPDYLASHKEQILKQIEEKIQREQPGANQRIKLGNAEPDILYQQKKPKAKPTKVEYKRWIKETQKNKQRGYLDVSHVSRLFNNPFSKAIGLAILICGILITIVRWCEDRQRAYVKKYDAYMKRKKERKRTKRNLGKHNVTIRKKRIPRIPLKNF